jgi:hypothetical protein
MSEEDNSSPATGYTEDELNAMTKDQLLVIVGELGIEGITSKNVKADIIQAILNA